MDNGKIYVGQTRRSVAERFKEHCHANSAIGKAIRKHGVEKFMCEVIAVCETKEELAAKEMFKIFSLDTPYSFTLFAKMYTHHISSTQRTVIIIRIADTFFKGL